MIKVVSEEEQQFLNTIKRGRVHFEKAIKNLPPASVVIPGMLDGVAYNEYLTVH